MGSAATAISTMLDRQVVISTPTVVMRKFNALDYAALEPAMLVKISYVEGISGSNVMIFRQKDMQIILNLLMGNDDPPSDDFTFDELSMSAACEVMNADDGCLCHRSVRIPGQTHQYFHSGSHGGWPGQ